jgi:hypothetical protein
MKREKILITDGLFPNKFATWRNVEIISFMEEYQASVLVKHGKSWAGIVFEIDFDHEIFSSVFSASKYNILIFDPEYNYLNKFNERIDGREFNGSLAHYSYLITEDIEFNLGSFKLVYHIFLGSYYDFNNSFNFSDKRQVIHLYPGGGFSPGQTVQIGPTASVISTHPLTSSEVERKGNPNLLCLTAPMYFRNEFINPSRYLNQTHIGVCFSSLGNGKAKGAQKYRRIATIYKILYPKSKVRFYSVGNALKSRFIKRFKPMAFTDLENFYANDVDIYVNLSTKHAFNGWPLGLEAVKNGCALLTTDPDHVAKFYNADEYEIRPIERTYQFISAIRRLEKNRDLLESTKKMNMEFARNFASYSAQQGKIFEFIDTLILECSRSVYEDYK